MNESEKYQKIIELINDLSNNNKEVSGTAISFEYLQELKNQRTLVIKYQKLLEFVKKISEFIEPNLQPGNVNEWLLMEGRKILKEIGEL